MLIPISSISQLANLRDLPVLAIDLGFSGSKASCGLAFRESQGADVVPQNYRFDACVKKAAELFASHKDSVLILEAPLSAAFNSKGNPQSRGDFEGMPKPRWWSLRAGAAMALAAQYFLKDLSQRIPKDVRCNLIEGFITGENSGNDADVAASLLSSLSSVKETNWHQPQGSLIISILDWIDPSTSPHACPIVLTPFPR